MRLSSIHSQNPVTRIIRETGIDGSGGALKQISTFGFFWISFARCVEAPVWKRNASLVTFQSNNVLTRGWESVAVANAQSGNFRANCRHSLRSIFKHYT
jgi:hypothetical protein